VRGGRPHTLTTQPMPQAVGSGDTEIAGQDRRVELNRATRNQYLAPEKTLPQPLGEALGSRRAFSHHGQLVRRKAIPESR
jgi:hypothetical protein